MKEVFSRIFVNSENILMKNFYATVNVWKSELLGMYLRNERSWNIN